MAWKKKVQGLSTYISFCLALSLSLSLTHTYTHTLFLLFSKNHFLSRSQLYEHYDKVDQFRKIRGRRKALLQFRTNHFALYSIRTPFPFLFNSPLRPAAWSGVTLLLVALDAGRLENYLDRDRSSSIHREGRKSVRTMTTLKRYGIASLREDIKCSME